MTGPAIGAVREQLTGQGGNGIRLGSPHVVGRLTLFPVFHDGPSVGYQLLSEASNRHALEVTEVGEGASVPALEARNTGDLPVLLLDGEILVGLKQNRMVNMSIVIGPHSSIKVPVSCVEARRWWTATKKASVSRHAISPRIRAAKMESLAFSARSLGAYVADQGLVWRGVDESLRHHKVSSRTRAYSDIEAKRSREIDRMLRGLKPQPGQKGMLAFEGNEPLALDVFDQESTLQGIWTELVSSYAAETLLNGNGTDVIDGDTASRWLRSLSDGEATCHPGVGLGETVLITGPRHNLGALVLERVPVHIAAWPA